ncbi:hypothetical protein [Dactylosporangium darangshiense]|uniref:hypothetical protein n=1 Tax=Dactylosporangium darangshiense TaxID=579108 RepID=UPI00362DF8DB
MTALTVAGPAALDGLAGRTGLRRLTVVGADVRRLPHLPSLTQVRFVACRLGDLGALLDAPALYRRDLLFSAFDRLDAGDDEVLLAGAGGIVAGVPHSRSAAAYRAELGDVASQYERVQCVRLWRRTGAVFGAGVLVRPGPAAFTAAPFDAVRIAAAELERELAAPGFSLERVFARYSALTPPGAASSSPRRPTRPAPRCCAGRSWSCGPRTASAPTASPSASRTSPCAPTRRRRSTPPPAVTRRCCRARTCCGPGSRGGCYCATPRRCTWAVSPAAPGSSASTSPAAA